MPVDLGGKQRQPGMRDQNVPAGIKSRRSSDERGAKEGRRGLIQHENCLMHGQKNGPIQLIQGLPFSRSKQTGNKKNKRARIEVWLWSIHTDGAIMELFQGMPALFSASRA